MTMGQTSSQVMYTEADTPSVDLSALIQTSNSKNIVRSKPRRKYKAAIDDPGRGQESVRALVQLKEKVPLSGESIPVGEDEIAASNMFTAVNANIKDNIEAHNRNETHKITGKRGKLKRQRLEFQEHEGKFTVLDRDDGTSKRARLNKSINTVKSQAALLPSSMSTNDVTIDAKGASEQEVCSSHTSPKTQTVAKPKPIMQQLVAKADNKPSDTPIQSSDRPSSQSRIDSSDATAQNQPNHPGQHGFHFASSTFNDDLSQPNLESANLFIGSNHRLSSSHGSCLDQ